MQNGPQASPDTKADEQDERVGYFPSRAQTPPVDIHRNKDGGAFTISPQSPSRLVSIK